MKTVTYVLKLYCAHINIDAKGSKCSYSFYMWAIAYLCVLDLYKFKLVACEINPDLLSLNSNACYITSDTYYEYL